MLCTAPNPTAIYIDVASCANFANFRALNKGRAELSIMDSELFSKLCKTSVRAVALLPTPHSTFSASSPKHLTVTTIEEVTSAFILQ